MGNDHKPGDSVRLVFGFADRSGAGTYEIVRVMPVGIDGEKQYRIRGRDGFERAIGGSQVRKTETIR